MPVSFEQKKLLRLLAINRSPSAYLAGGLIGARRSSRMSDDVDLFHDTPELLTEAFESDLRCLEEEGYTVEAKRLGPSMIRATASKDGYTLRIDWAQDPSWHFFQPLENEETGFELHWADAATNKVLAMASRSEIRDAFDVMFWHKNPISLGALIWAAAGKDMGLSPMMILEEIRRHARISPDELGLLNTVSQIDPKKFGLEFRQASRDAETLLLSLPPETIGHLFLDAEGNVIEPDPNDPETLSRPLAPRKGGLTADVISGPSP